MFDVRGGRITSPFRPWLSTSYANLVALTLQENCIQHRKLIGELVSFGRRCHSITNIGTWKATGSLQAGRLQSVPRSRHREAYPLISNYYSLCVHPIFCLSSDIVHKASAGHAIVPQCNRTVTLLLFKMPSDQAPEATFHFFDLPRELRDKIYSEIGGDKISGRVIFAHAKSLKSDYPPDTECWNVSPLPRPALRLVSRQFSDEYEDMIAPLEKVLRVECGCTDIPDEEHPDSDVDNRLKLAAREVKTMELTIDTHTLAFTDQEIDWASKFSISPLNC